MQVVCTIEDTTSVRLKVCLLGDECISEWEYMLYDEGLNSKVALALYRIFRKKIGVKKYLHGVSDARSRLLLMFRSGTHGLNEELGRHGARKGKVQCIVCGAECESVLHVPIVVVD